MTLDQHIGMRHDPTHEGWAHIDIEPHHCNPTGAVNGGVILSLADNVATGAANRAYHDRTGERAFLVGVDVHAVLVANQIGGSIRARGEAIRVGRRITVVRTEVRGDEDRLLATVTTTHVPT
jgi:uncharacterized protein (TIGR00369 family)